MKNVILTLAIVASLILCSCQNNPTANKDTKLNIEATQFIGSWVQPNPINDKEVQGFILKNDGTAQSINMETLKYQKWWYESNSLFLVAESIGNRTSSIDTMKYEVVKINEKELELKDRDYTDKYRKQ
ncbi:MAG: lipocalin family protein [Bacteroidota bacterium]